MSTINQLGFFEVPSLVNFHVFSLLQGLFIETFKTKDPKFTSEDDRQMFEPSKSVETKKPYSSHSTKKKHSDKRNTNSPNSPGMSLDYYCVILNASYIAY